MALRKVEKRLLSELGDERKTSGVKSVLQTASKNSRRKTLPTKVDNRKYCSPVKDQGQLGVAQQIWSICMNT